MVLSPASILPLSPRTQGGWLLAQQRLKGHMNHQSSIFLFDPDTGQCRAMLAGNTITAQTAAAARSPLTGWPLVSRLPWAWLVRGINQPFSLRLRLRKTIRRDLIGTGLSET